MTDKQVYEMLLEMKDRKIKELENKLYNKILIIEDGSVIVSDLEKLKKDGFYVIVYRQGSTPPQFLKEQ